MTRPDSFGEFEATKRLFHLLKTAAAELTGATPDESERVGKLVDGFNDILAEILSTAAATGLMPMAERIATLVESSQLAEGPRIGVAVGVVACPADGEEAETLIEAAQQATYGAKAAGRSIGTGPGGPAPALQDQ